MIHRHSQSYDILCIFVYIITLLYVTLLLIYKFLLIEKREIVDEDSNVKGVR